MKAPRTSTRMDAIRAVAVKDFTAVRRSKGVVLPMLIVPFLLLVVLPLIVGIAARNAGEIGPSTFASMRARGSSGARGAATWRRIVSRLGTGLIAP